MMLSGAFCGVWAALISGSLIAGFIGAAVGGALVALSHGVLCLVFRAEQVVSGVILNILVLGLTTFLIGPVFGADLGRAAPTLQPNFYSVSFGPSNCRPSFVFTNTDCLSCISVGARLVPSSTARHSALPYRLSAKHLPRASRWVLKSAVCGGVRSWPVERSPASAAVN